MGRVVRRTAGMVAGRVVGMVVGMLAKGWWDGGGVKTMERWRGACERSGGLGGGQCRGNCVQHLKPGWQ